MSQRSIIEINHDFTHVIDREGGRVVDLLLAALASGADRSWQPLERYGIRRIVQAHHTDERKVVITSSGGSQEYPIP